LAISGLYLGIYVIFIGALQVAEPAVCPGCDAVLFYIPFYGPQHLLAVFFISRSDGDGGLGGLSGVAYALDLGMRGGVLQERKHIIRGDGCACCAGYADLLGEALSLCAKVCRV
jgi:hypothetical protein